jgi:F-type H+-transporting ATPase subunit gamma
MPSLRDIRRRIMSVRKTRQITRAMRMVAAAKLRRAQERTLAARPYATKMLELARDVVHANKDLTHPLLVRRDPVRKVDALVITSDRGLAGAFNANVLKYAQRVLEAREAVGAQASLILVGRKAIDYFRRRRPGAIVHAEAFGVASYDKAVDLAQRVAARFVAGEADETLLVYSEFVSTLSQHPRDVRLFPYEPPTQYEKIAPFSAEPDPQTLLNLLLPKVLETAIHRALLESQVGEFAARMTAMESATRNSEEMIDSLTLKFNRARQAAITKELMEIIGGAEAL